MRIWLLLLVAVASSGADLGPDLRNAARKGQTSQVEALLAKGAAIDSPDRDGRTALMLAAGRGRAATVKLLLARGASPQARDREGWTAYALALAAGRDEVLKLLPAPSPMVVFMDPGWDRANLYSSCFMTPPQLVQHIAALEPGMLVAVAIRDFAASNGRGRLEFIATPGGDAVLHLKSRPAVSCMPQQTLDNLSLEIDVRLERTAGGATLLEKTFGGGLKGLHARTVSSPAQYQPLLAGWASSHAPQIYWAAVEAWLRAE
jgi:Ankyrin repeats (3 copies)